MQYIRHKHCTREYAEMQRRRLASGTAGNVWLEVATGLFCFDEFPADPFAKFVADAVDHGEANEVMDALASE